MHGPERNRPRAASDGGGSITDFGPAWGAIELDSLRDRLRSDRPTRWDLVVVGAGIVGAGIARDAAGRGLSVLVLEAEDACFGTSSRSTRLIHGGLRYLEHGDFRLVFEALRERGRLYRTAPHLVRPARFLFPGYRGDRLPLWKLRAGLTVYDALNLFRGDVHEFMSADTCLAIEPSLRASELEGALAYEDAITDDARLTLTVLQDARRRGADVLTYAAVETIGRRDETYEIVLTDGTRVSARQTVVAAGAWTSSKLLGKAAEGLLSLSRGVHLVVDHRHAPIQHPLVLQDPDEPRIVFVVPWGPCTYVGTTDAPFADDPARVGTSSADERRLLSLVQRLLPRAALGPGNVISAWAGVRPLVRPEHATAPTAEISRRHLILESENGVIGLVGGKLTTFRAMAEEVVDLVIRRLDGDLKRRPCTTREAPLVPGRPIEPAELENSILRDLEPRHGPFARILAGRANLEPAMAEPLVRGLPYRWVEVDAALEHEGVTHLTDILRRRLPLVLTDRTRGGTVARTIATRLIDRRGGSQRDVDDELDRFRRDVLTETGREPLFSSS